MNHTISGYSAHAVQKELINFVKRMRINHTDIRIVHGDEYAKYQLKNEFELLFLDAVIATPKID